MTGPEPTGPPDTTTSPAPDTFRPNSARERQPEAEAGQKATTEADHANAWARRESCRAADPDEPSVGGAVQNQAPALRLRAVSKPGDRSSSTALLHRGVRDLPGPDRGDLPGGRHGGPGRAGQRLLRGMPAADRAARPNCLHPRHPYALLARPRLTIPATHTTAPADPAVAGSGCASGCARCRRRGAARVGINQLTTMLPVCGSTCHDHLCARAPAQVTPNPVATPALGLHSRHMATDEENPSRCDITTMLKDQTSACKAARDAVAVGGEVMLYDERLARLPAGRRRSCPLRPRIGGAWSSDLPVLRVRPSSRWPVLGAVASASEHRNAIVQGAVPHCGHAHPRSRSTGGASAEGFWKYMSHSAMALSGSMKRQVTVSKTAPGPRKRAAAAAAASSAGARKNTLSLAVRA